ncbi:FkbM family methyltransferase [Methanonatronarchaeum sp. AMET6-2]|uniref:FkbM family methyltransferase n=1 Tax=Methanonatronarchaeum sp. AMET6-2 TaxID=2933293 RepID=UPI001FF42A76|nr:FkbM family methyltransferase [Methanonatronarchaeum sp. AMET6-2]UOY10274.1 FkbM family methyltransferase [Methanonatronarchaeum sp. AMET6-2]
MNKINRFFEIANRNGYLAATTSTYKFLNHHLKEKYKKIVNKPKLYFLRRKNGNSLIREINGSKMKLDLSNSSINSIERKLALKGEREPGITETLENILDILKTNYDAIHVFDVGANIGYYTLLEARVLGEKGKIYAIEAEPRNVDRLKNNITLNGYNQIKVFNKAAGAKRTKETLNIKDKSNLHRMTSIDNDGYSDSIEVEVRPIDEIVEKQAIPKDEPVVIRMDIEGYEGYAFKGMKNLLESNQPIYVFVELHDRDYNPKKIVTNLLKEYNFKPEYISPDGGKSIKKLNKIDKYPEKGNIHLVASKNI